MELILKTESADRYSYALSDEILDFLPKHVLQGLARYRLHWM